MAASSETKAGTSRESSRKGTQRTRSGPIEELNASYYVFDAASLGRALEQLDADNAQGELYLTDAVESIVAAGGRAVAHRSEADPVSLTGVNTRADLAQAAAALRDRINEGHLLAGVTIVDPQTAWIDDPSSSRPTPPSSRSPSSRARRVLRPAPRSVRTRSRTTPTSDRRRLVGPFCYLRPGTVLAAGAKAGTFVEIKNTHVGERSKVPHLSYIGDADIGEDSNIGAGAITANFPHDPDQPKQRTKIGRNVRTAVHNAFVAPVDIGDDSWTAAGTVVTDDVPPDRSLDSRRGRSQRRATSVQSATTTMTELTKPLPGIEVETALPEPQPGHWLERAPGKRLMVFSGRSHPGLAQRIAEHLGVELGEIELETFANGESYCRYGESIRGADVFLVQTGSEPVDRNIWELLLMIQAAKLASAKRITAVIPWFAYSRQDRKARPREPISARLLADTLQLAGADRVLTMDLHAGQIQGFFNIPVDHMTALPLFVQHFHDLGLTGPEVVSVAPDAGRAKYAHRFSELINADFAIMHKTRPAHDMAEITEITGSVDGKIAVVGDDMTTTGGTLIAGAETLKENGAKEVWMFVTHLLVRDEALERLGDSGITGLVVTDTVPIDPTRKPDNMTVLTVSRLLADTIMNVFDDESVSAIFGPENQLF